MTSREVQKPRKTRAGGYHVRTGCNTCKIRHVKCDEGKPACNQCTRTGRVCDGYETIKTIRYGEDITVCHFRTRIHPIRPPPLDVQPYVQISDTARGRRSFAYFLHQVGQELSQAFRTPVLHQLILQMSHCDNAVREAVIALGSLGERLQLNNVLTWDNQQANECHEYAVAEYGKAISHLRGQLSDGGEKLELQALIMCFLFTIFEFLQGSESGALVHLRHGLRILDKVHQPDRECSVLAEEEAMSLEMKRTGNSINSIIKTRVKPIMAKDAVLREELVWTYAVMENQALYWLSLESWEAPLLTNLQTMDRDPPNCEYFPTLEEAADALNYQINIVQEVRRTFISVEASDPSAWLASLLAFNHRKRERQIKQLLKWPSEVAAMRARLADGWTVDMTHRINVMKMNYTITLLLLEGVFEPIGVVSNRDSELAFEEVIRLAKTILLPLDDEDRMTRIRRVVLANNKDINPDAMFSFYAGLIQPLYNTAIKCQNLAICHEAIGLLATRPWREGAWESAGMAKIARRKCEDRVRIIMAGSPKGRSGGAAC